jgi:hypothetical protein
MADVEMPSCFPDVPEGMVWEAWKRAVSVEVPRQDHQGYARARQMGKRSAGH